MNVTNPWEFCYQSIYLQMVLHTNMVLTKKSISGNTVVELGLRFWWTLLFCRDILSHSPAILNEEQLFHETLLNSMIYHTFQYLKKQRIKYCSHNYGYYFYIPFPLLQVSMWSIFIFNCSVCSGFIFILLQDYKCFS